MIDSREKKILKTAEKYFSIKGFDATSVDFIAEKAGVNKALIYYYFKNKKDLLEKIISFNAEELFESINKKFERPVDINSVSVKVFITNLISTIEKKKNFIRIILNEGMNKGSGNDIIFNLLDRVMDKHLLLICSEKIEGEALSVFRMEHFFMALMPIFSFVLLKERFAKFYDTGLEGVIENFITHISEIKSIQIEKYKKKA